MSYYRINCLEQALESANIKIHDENELARLSVLDPQELRTVLQVEYGLSQEVVDQIVQVFENCLQSSQQDSFSLTILPLIEPVKDYCNILSRDPSTCLDLFEEHLPRNRELAKEVINSIVKYYAQTHPIDVEINCRDVTSAVTRDGLVIYCEGEPIIKVSFSGGKITLLP